MEPMIMIAPLQRIAPLAIIVEPGGNPKKLMEFLRDRAGLILPRGVRLYSLPHRTFQEYLAACHLTDDEFPEKIVELTTSDPQRWREVCLLAGAKASRGMANAIWMLADHLCPREPDDSERGVPDMWGALLAGQALAETASLNKMSPPNRAKLERVKKWLLRIICGDELPALERVNAGNALAVLGDTRFNAEKWFLSVDGQLGFVDIPAGPFSMGSNEKKDPGAFEEEMPQHTVDLPSFKIALFPVTVAQYRCFAAEAGKEIDYWWKKNNRIDNHPVVAVSWHDAKAYCEWLTGKLRGLGWNGVVRLPTEAQWEKAARGTDGRIYPWGEDCDPNHANYSDTGIGGTSPVGCFSAGQSPYGLYDMAGNVWEWTSTIYGKAFF